ncbi:MAG: hypothetical protein WCD86_07450 [Ktedonobacteraceae bacterium]
MIGFQYHPDILARYPTIVAGVMLARDMTAILDKDHPALIEEM